MVCCQHLLVFEAFGTKVLVMKFSLQGSCGSSCFFHVGDMTAQ